MGGSIEYTRSVKSVKCDCTACYHSRRIRSKIKNLDLGTLDLGSLDLSHINLTSDNWYCSYYDVFNPKKTSCVKFYKIRKSSAPKSKDNKTNKKKRKSAPKQRKSKPKATVV